MKDYLKMEDQPVISIEKQKSEGILKAATLWVSVLVTCLGMIVGTAVAQDQGQTPGNTAKRATYLSARATDLKPSAPATAEPKTEPAAASSKTDSADLVEQLDELRSAMDSQAAQIEIQRELLKEQQQKMEALEEQLKTASAGGLRLDAAPAPTMTVASASAAGISPSVPLAQPPAASPQGAAAVPASPLQLQVGNAFITPVGFMDFTTVFRNHNAGGGIGSNFGNIPYDLTSSAGAVNLLNHNSETRLSMQNSRVGFRVDALVAGAHVIGYMESDFLGNNPTNVAVSSNSNTFRSRLYWVDVAKDKWEILGGQTWSLITPGRTGISPLPGNLFFSNDIDVNYQVGLVWGRIPEIRFVYRPTGKVAVAVALDNQEQYWGGSAGGPKPLLPTGASVVAGVAGLPGTQLNDQTTTVNAPQLFPDVIAKIAFDPSPKFHGEIGGVERQFRVAVNSTTATTSPIVKQRVTGGGAFLNLNGQVYTGLRLITNNFWNQGGGRYIFGQVPDVLLNPDGSMVPIKSASTVTGFEYTHKNTVFYSYYGGVYVYRNLRVANGNEYGYGVHATAANFATAISQNRAIQEATVGMNETIWRDTKYGAVNLMGQYSYLIRNPWSVTAGSSTHAALNLLFFNLRYTLPGAAPAAGQLK
jgi:hypothetical protein